MNGVLFPQDFQLEPLQKNHPRRQFDCGQGAVNDWLSVRFLVNYRKRHDHIVNRRTLQS